MVVCIYILVEQFSPRQCGQPKAFEYAEIHPFSLQYVRQCFLPPPLKSLWRQWALQYIHTLSLYVNKEECMSGGGGGKGKLMWKNECGMECVLVECPNVGPFPRPRRARSPRTSSWPPGPSGPPGRGSRTGRRRRRVRKRRTPARSGRRTCWVTMGRESLWLPQLAWCKKKKKKMTDEKHCSLCTSSKFTRHVIYYELSKI